MIIAATFYSGNIRDAIRAAKFDKNPARLHLVAEAMYHSIDSLKFDFYIPIPTTDERLKARGYNIPSLLTKFLAQRKRKPINEFTLTRNSGPTQYGITPEQRRDNQNMFSPGKSIFSFKNSTALIIDDVVATGTTFDNATNILGQHGIHCICLAAAMSPRTPHYSDTFPTNLA